MIDHRVGMHEVYYERYGEVLSPYYKVVYKVKAITKGRKRQQV
jgi:hypothetical protein